MGPPVGTTSLTVLRGFEGVHYGDNNGALDYVSQPDAPVAAGPSHVVEIVNGPVMMWTKDGTLVKQTNPQALFKTAPFDGVGNPRILFDAASGRWFASAGDFTSGSVLLAVSASGDPTGSWNAYNYSTGADCPDQPLLGLSSDKVVLFSNVFSGCTGAFYGGEFWVINKTDLVAGSAPRYAAFGPNSGYYSMFPVHSLSPTATEYMVRAISPNYVRVYAVAGTPPGTVSVTSKDYGIASIGSTVNAVQPGTSVVLRTGDLRVRDAFWKDGRLWLAFNDGCTPAGDNATRSCFRLAELDTANQTVVQDFDVGSDSMYYFYPALREDALGNLVVVFGASSSSMYPSVLASTRSPSDPANTLQPPTVVRAGNGPETPATGNCPVPTICKWGDYSGAGVDPADPTIVWTCAEYGTASGWATYVSAIRAAVATNVTFTLSFSVQGGGSGFQAPTFTFVQGGATTTVVLSGTPTSFRLDPGSPWSVTEPLAGSSGTERWSTGQTTGGSATADLTAAFTYVRQFAVVFTDVVLGGGSGYSAPTVAYVSHGASGTAAVDTEVWADAGTAYAYPPALPGSSSSEAWRAGATSGVISGPGTLSATYYHEYSVTFAYTIAGGGSGYQAPTINYTRFGAPETTAAGSAVWADASTPYAFTNPLAGSSGTERWTAPSASGTIASAGTVTVRYYHLLIVAFTFTVIGGGTGYSAPNVSYTDRSVAAGIAAAGAWVWADAGSRYQYENPLPGSTAQESWRAQHGSGTIASSALYAVSYRHQYRTRFHTTSTTGSPVPEAPLLNVTQFDAVVSLPADAVDWADAGGWYSFPGAFNGPLPGERWISDAPPSGQILAPEDITASYLHQFYLLIQVNAPAGGTVSGASGWYNGSATLTLVAAAGPGWRFEGWVGSGDGSYGGASGSASVRMDAPVTETAVFYAGLTLVAGGGGTLSYSYGGTTGWVPSGAAETIFVAPGTTVAIVATPSPFHEFQRWTVTGGPSTSILVNAPMAVSAEFGVSLYSKADSVLGATLAVILVLAVALGARRRRRRKTAAALRVRSPGGRATGGGHSTGPGLSGPARISNRRSR